MGEQKLLRPNTALPNRQEASILVLGAEGTNKHDLSLTMLKLPVQFSLQIRTAIGLPLPEENAETRPRIDFICFLIDLTDRDSLQVLEKSLTLVDVKFFLGKACLVVSGAQSRRRMTAIDQVKALADSFHLPLLFGETKVEKERDQLARRLLHMVDTAAGFQRYISPAVLDASKCVSLS